MDDALGLTPIGHVVGGRTDVIDDDWGGNRSAIHLDPATFTGDALEGLPAFSHVEVIFVFDRVPPEKVEFGARRPRGREDWPRVGIFAQRGKNRPNRLGLCACRLVGVDGLSVIVDGLDAVDGTPVLDIKPVMTGFLPRGEIREPAWAVEIMADYW